MEVTVLYHLDIRQSTLDNSAKPQIMTNDIVFSTIFPHGTYGMVKLREGVGYGK